MQFTIWVKHRGDHVSQTWREDYNEPDVDDPKAWARQLIKDFNANRAGGARSRVLVNVRVCANNVPLPHQWRKTNLVTIQGRRSNVVYDTYRCEMCGATGKRYGLNAGYGIGVTLDNIKKYGGPCRGERS